jgi:hypothetical protein
VPGAVGVKLPLKLAVLTPPVVEMLPVPLTPVLTLQLELKSVKLTEPVGAVEVVPWKVAVSETVKVVPTTWLAVGLALVVIVGLALVGGAIEEDGPSSEK